MTYRPLPKLFRKDSYQYCQIYRDEEYAIYTQFDGDKFISYEVFKINKNNERVIAGKIISASESVPPSSQWGTNAWTCATLADCYEKIDQMIEAKLNQKSNP